MNFLELAATVMGIAMSVGHFPQAYTMVKNKSGKNVSLITYGIFALGSQTWFVYGLVSHTLPITLSYAPGVVGSWLVLGLKLWYTNRV